MIEGIDGAGKGVVNKVIKEFLGDKKSYDLHNCDDELGIPEYKNVKDNEVYFTYEPSKSLVGRFVRYHLTRSDTKFEPMSAVHGFALDREILYKKLIINAINDCKIIIQDRGVLSSLIYQHIQVGIPMELIAGVPGNKVALQNPPDYIIIVTVDPEIALKRADDREKTDNHIFEKLDFQKKIYQFYKSDVVKKFFPNTKFFHIDTNCTEQETIEKTKKILNEIF